MNENDFDEEEFDAHYRKQTEFSVFISTVLLLGFIVISFVLCRVDYPESIKRDVNNTYEMLATIENIEREGDKFSMVIYGVHEGVLESYTIDIDKQQFMHYKEGQEINVKVTGNHCYIVE